MKRILHVTLIIVLLSFMSCGSDDSDATLSLTESFNLTVDSETIPITTWQALRTFDNIEILGDADDGKSFYMRINENGVLDRVDYDDFDNGLDFSSSYYNPSETFIVQNISIDENNKIINISFEGTLYENDLDVFSPSSTVEITQSSINIKFVENPTAISPDQDTFIDAKINGELFQSMKHATSTGIDSNLISYSGDSDGIASININFDKVTTTAGTYNFTSNDQATSVSYSTFDPFTEEFGEFIDYETSGTLIIEVYTPSTPTSLGLLKGSFECTATANGQTVNITEGRFNFTFF
ncbi:hypothetical protein [uncultured Aquimarina sp.]|uniref:hypothetical protein n=1 Tax=uncultured Aquimarina sp. TaxID=575652 RepID=UPI00263A0AA4|nr:hypothetical protein [uncultured Aquimarina sp.]